jgi:plasmid stability protein
MNINYPIPDSLHQALKVRAAQKGVTLKDLIIGYLMRMLEEDDD